ncbi:hypothetical protein H4582DRAFT_1952891 [Lactarius indigo]|nr:hypothetical protein H4582DRAFT_1952891 [Lactarius indigo]
MSASTCQDASYPLVLELLPFHLLPRSRLSFCISLALCSVTRLLSVHSLGLISCTHHAWACLGDRGQRSNPSIIHTTSPIILIRLRGLELAMLQLHSRREARFFPSIQLLPRFSQAWFSHDRLSHDWLSYDRLSYDRFSHDRFSHAPGSPIWDPMPSSTYQERRGNTLLSMGGFSCPWKHIFDVRSDLLRSGPGEDRRGRVPPGANPRRSTSKSDPISRECFVVFSRSTRNAFVSPSEFLRNGLLRIRAS